MNLATIRAGVKATVSSLSGFEVGNLRPAPIAPGCLVYPKAPIGLDLTFEGANTEFDIIVLLLVPFNDVDNGQARIDAYLNTDDPTSFISLLRASSTLSGAVKSWWVHTLETYEVMSFDGGVTEFIGCEVVGKVVT